MTTATADISEAVKAHRWYQAHGAALVLWRDTSPEVVLSGPAGTGKSRACLEKLHACCLQWPGMRALIVRKTRESLTESALVTYESNVLTLGDPVAAGPQRRLRQAYHYPNGSEVVVGGLDKPSKVMSTEYDLIYCLVGETRVTSDTPIQKAFVREYSGPLVTIRTARGNELTGTPNHPILTDQGWVALGLLREGDHVISRRLVEDERAGGNPDVQDEPPTIAEIARALTFSPSCRTERVETVAMDFHGDGGHGDVEIISADRGFHLGRNPTCLYPVTECYRPGRHLQSQPLVGRGAAGDMLIGVGACDVAEVRVGAVATEPLLVLGGLDPSFSGAFAGLPESVSPVGIDVPDMPIALGLARGPRSQSPAAQLGLECGITDADRGGNSVEPAFSFEVTRDRVVHVNRFDQPPGTSRHVYNLQTEDHRYIANNIVSHNCQEAIELYENDWESLTTRLRNGVMPFQQMIADTNPDAPTHWLRRRADAGRTVMHESRHEDNPVIWDVDRGEWTTVGAQYIAKLDALTGVRFHRLRHGRWVGSEGMVYGDWDRNIHLIDRFPIPDSWRRVRSVDFGYTNPFVCQWWAIDGDGRMFLYREIYRTKRTVADHAVPIKAKSEGERIEATVSDHDAEDRATLHQVGVQTIPAHKAITPGIQAVEERLRVAGDGRARLFVFRDALVSRDEELADAKLPTSTAEEFDAYIWPKGQDGKALKEIPVDANNHGMDAMRYAVAYLDLVPRPGPSASAPRVAPVMPAVRQAMPRYGMATNMGGRR